MNASEFDLLMNTVQGVYGKTIKSDTREVTWDRVCMVPSRHVKPITDRLCDRERMPDNLSKAILDAWTTLAPGEACESEDKDRFTTRCAVCDPGPWQGQIRAYKKTPTGLVGKFYFDCPLCKPSSQHQGTREQIASWGYIVPPTQWDVSKHEFRMFAANDVDGLIARLGISFCGLLQSTRRMALGAVEPRREDAA